MSVAAPAVTQESSSSAASCAEFPALASSLLEGAPSSLSSPAGLLRFLGFLSPLKVNGLTMVRRLDLGEEL